MNDGAKKYTPVYECSKFSEFRLRGPFIYLLYIILLQHDKRLELQVLNSTTVGFRLILSNLAARKHRRLPLLLVQ